MSLGLPSVSGMASLKRVGSFRRSLRRRKKDLEVEDGLGVATKKIAFALTVTDTIVSPAVGFQPSHLVVTIDRRRLNSTSVPVPWEASLKTSSTGSGVWHPPFVCVVKITPSADASGSPSGHKDVILTLQNFVEGKKTKTLAKARLDLADFFDSEAKRSFKLKLFPETAKIIYAAVNVTVERCLLQVAATVENGNVATTSPNSSLANVKCQVELSPHSEHSPFQSSSPKHFQRANIEEGKPEPQMHVESSMRSYGTISQQPSPSRPSGGAADLDDLDTPHSESIQVNQKANVVEICNWEPSSKCSQTDLVVLPPERSPPARIDSFKNASNVQITSDLESGEPLDSNQQQLSGSFPLENSQPIADQLTTNALVEEENLSHSSDAEIPEINLFKSPAPLPSSFTMKVPPSPKMMPNNKQSATERDLIEWTKSSLRKYPNIKVTNLSSSWRNGLGFCALIHLHHPELIPINSLKMHNMEVNNQLAIEASKLMGAEVSFDSSRLPEKSAVVPFLQQLREVLAAKIDDATVVLEFQCRWFSAHGFFEETAGPIVAERLRSEQEAKEAEERLSEEREKLRKEEDREKARHLLYKNGKECQDSPAVPADQESRLRNRERVRELIAEGHDSLVVVEEAVENDQDEIGREAESQQFPESQTIAEELSSLVEEEQRVNRQKLELQEIIRDEMNCPEDMEAAMQKKYMELVNQSNAIVRRQMQLNIEEKMKRTTWDISLLQSKLQQLSTVEETAKTETMKVEEQNLVSKLVEAVNRKDELVLHLDSQEKAIAEDERISAAIVGSEMTVANKQDRLIQRLFFKR